MTRDPLESLVQDAVADVEPADRLSEIRARTAAAPSPRRWWVAAGGAALATAAVVTAIAVVGSDPVPTTDPGPVATPSPTPPEGRAVPAYFIGGTPDGPRLFREYRHLVDPPTGLAGLGLLEAGPLDPDYATEWTRGDFVSVSDPEAGVVHVRLGPDAPDEPSALAEQQVVYTLNAAYQERLEVVFHRGDEQSAPVLALPRADVVSLVNLSDPVEGQVVGGGTLRLRGLIDAFENNVPWTITGPGIEPRTGAAIADGQAGELNPFDVPIDVSSLDPGTYTVRVEVDDPSGETTGSYADTRTFVIE